jgi:hypothetical protein
MAKINLNSILSETKNAVERIEETVEVAQQPLPDFDAILMEWSWRCEKGYPDFNNKKDMLALKEVLKEMNLSEIDIQRVGLTQLNEALSQEQQDAVTASASLFTVENINKLGYGNYVNKIVNAFAEYTTNNPDPEVLAYFIKDKVMIETPEALQTFLKAYQKDKLVIRLYTVAAKDAQDDKPESGRGAMGRGEVLIGMLTQATSGGTAKADNAIGNTSYEVKASKETVIKVPLAAKRIDRLTSLNRLDDVYAACKSFMDDKVAWEDYVKGCFPKGSKLASKFDKDLKAGGKYIFDAGIAPSSGNINGQELENFKIFFKALKEKLDSKKTENDEYYVDLDSITTGSDKYFKGLVKNPNIFNNLSKGNVINIEVVEGDASTAVELQRMETRLRQCVYVQNPEQLDKDLIADCATLLNNRFIVFHEASSVSTQVPVPILLAPEKADGKQILIVNFSLNAAAISYKGSLTPEESKELEASI